MKLKGVRALRRTYNGIFALTGEVKKVREIIYGDIHNLPEELVDLPKEEGYYTIEGELIDHESWVDPVDWLPKGMLDEWKYVAMDGSGAWYVYSILPMAEEKTQMFSVPETETHFSVDQMFKTYPDPLGWRQSLHVRDEDGNWKRF
jgi:hypothetical protein